MKMTECANSSSGEGGDYMNDYYTKGNETKWETQRRS